jgi:predicted PurR-regulated permease PerM
VHSYLAIKAAISLLTGLVIFVWLTILGVDYAVLWGLIAFLLNFIPTVGSFIAAVPAVLLALVQLGVFEACLTLAGFVVVNLIMGNVLEPRWMGRGLNLSPLVVFVSLVLWGWVLGPVGMLLSIPLTIMLKIAFESQDETRWIGIMLGAGKRLDNETLLSDDPN